MKSRFTLRTRLVMLVLTAIAPLFGLSLVGTALTAEDALTQATKNLEFSASLVAANQQRVADSARQVLSAISVVPDLVEAKEPFCQRYFSTLTSELPLYVNVGIIGADGYMRCHSFPNNPKGFRGDRLYFQTAMESSNFVTSGYLIGRAANQPVMTFGLPVKAGDGSVLAVAFASILLSDLSKTIASVPVPVGGRVVIMDRNGVVLAASPGSSASVGKPMPVAQIRDAVKSGLASVFDAADASGIEQIYAFRPSSPLPNPPFFVLVSADRSEVLAPARLQLIRNLFALALIAFFGSWIAWLLARRAILRPVREILEATGRIQAGAMDTRILVSPGATKNELTLVTRGFNSMADTIQQREQEQAKSYADLRQTQNQLLAAQKLGRFGHWDLDLSSDRVTWSDELHHLFGLKPGGFDGEHATFLKMLHPDDRPRYEEQRAAALINSTALDIEYRILTPSGEVRWMHHRGQLINDEAGLPLSRGGVVQDITAQHESRQHLLLLEAAIANLNDVVLITEAEPFDEPGPRIVYVNDAFERHTGYSREEALGRTPRMLQGPDTQQSELRRMSRALKAWQPVRVELTNYTKTGQQYWVEIEIVPIANDKGWYTHWVSVQRDITHRKAAEIALTNSEQRYAVLFDTAPVPMWVFAAVDHRFLTVNHAAVENYGYSAAEFQSMTIYDIRDAQDHVALRNHMLGQTDHRKHWQHRRKDGSALMVAGVAKSIRYMGKEACFVVALDVTAQVQAEKAVQDQVLMLRRAADAAQAIIWQQTVEDMLQEAADQARFVLKAHQSAISLTPDTELSQVINALSLSEKHAMHRGLHDLPDASGMYAMVCDNNSIVRMSQAELEAHPRWHEFQSYAEKYPPLRGWLAVPLTGRTGEKIGLLHLSDKLEGEFTLQDEYVVLELAQLASSAIENARLLEQIRQLNTGLEQKVIERTLALSRQEALFRALAEQAPQVIWTADNTGATNYFNRAWFDLVGGTLEDWTGLKWSSAVHPEDLAQTRQNWKCAVATRSAFAGTRRVFGRDGGYHVMSYKAAPVLDEDGEVSFWVGIDVDVTELKGIESALRLSNQELEAFSYSVSHDLRAPLNTIDGFSRLLAKQITDDAGPKVQHYVARIQAGVAQMGKLIEDLLSLAQVSRTQLRYELVDLSVLSRCILDEWQGRDPDRHVELHIEPGLVAQGDTGLIRVLLENLLSNAWKFTSQLATANITIGQQPDADGSPVFFVRDDGAGFDMAYADKLFIAFQRLHAVSEFPGTGVGLATVSRIVGRHGGQLRADASPGKGATFFFTLARARVATSDQGI